MEQAPQRLKRRREFLEVARAGRKWAAPGLVLQVLDRHAMPTGKTEDRTKSRQQVNGASTADEKSIRVGFTVSRKVGGAVVRNRARRRLRAAVEKVMPTHAAPGRDYVVIGRGRTNTRPFPDLVGDLEAALRKLNAWQEAASTANGPGIDKENRNA
jgi:ribonuclease P protein component